MADAERYQFDVRRLLLLMTVVGVSFSIGKYVAPPRLQTGTGLYFALLSAWAVMRLPAVRANLADVRRRRREMLKNRRRLAEEVDKSTTPRG